MINSLSTARSFFRALPCGEYHTQRGETSRWGNPPDPNLSFSSARRKELKEASTYPKPFPIWKGCNCLRAETALRQSFCIARRAFAPSGRAMIKNISRVPRYQNGEKSSVSATFRVASSPYRGRPSRRFLRLFVLHPPHIGGGLGGGGCFFASFFAPKKVREMGSGGIPQRRGNTSLRVHPEIINK